MMKFVLVGNRMGNVRFCRSFCSDNLKARSAKEQEMLRLCLKDQKQEGFVEYQDTMLIYRLYTNLIFVAGTSLTENELAVMEVLQNFVETVIKHFEQVSEQDFVYNMDKIHMILDEMVVSGTIAETNKSRVLLPLQLMDATRR
ncbi:AP-4 complex subunit sigma-1-like [Ylistrum balloti]|uniref:AP-4 complex subunit sigma-1-like n=1 Tax=Ylistrum balloti TaxID=509963 RepID=UPI002905BEB9|nr:AP-4 complex subunit sigma-1-like [Ylistrum balloti]XP_060077528.1 AP-4 complex subunit sigma-1-like [Ylistrum balloti]XP_060077529.1 AP-4 complex subunit sigma-1-like [Ylistrum balloti]